MNTNKDYYEILGVDKDAPREEIRKAYLHLAKIHHPDVSSSLESEDKFKSINEAYSILYNEKERKAYEKRIKEDVKWKKEFKEELDNIDVFVKYVRLMKEFKSRRKNLFDVFIKDVFSRYVIVKISKIDLERMRFKRGSIVSIRAKGIITNGATLEEYSAVAVVKLIHNLDVTLEIMNFKRAKLAKNTIGKLRYEEDPRFLYSNIERNMDNILSHPLKFKNFRSLITDIYNNYNLGLEELGIYEPNNQTKINLFYKGLNTEQKELVSKSMDFFKNPHGYILACSAPGGTGKTECIVEIIRQLLKENKKIRILVTSFTNVAVDNVFSKLIKKDNSLSDVMIRVAQEQSIKLKKVKKVSISRKTKMGFVKLDLIKEHKIIGATLDKVGTIMFEEVDFDVVIIDEASMVEFPKIMLVASKTQKLILIGDDKQLGPFFNDEVRGYLRINHISDTHIDQLLDSFFIKLISYLKNTNSSALVELKEQYRSYEEIIKFPNEEFYEGKLKTAYFGNDMYNFINQLGFKHKLIKDILDTKKRVVWLDLSDLGGNLKFSSNKDWHKKYPKKDIRYFHIGSAAFLILILKKLLNVLYYKFKDNLEYRQKIGIISPYNDQIDLILRFLHLHPEVDPFLKEKINKDKYGINKDLFKIEKFLFTDQLELGTVHKFQGREKDIIIYDITSFTGKRTSKLLQDFRILNVALTRARTKLIIIGNILENQEYYSSLHNPKYSQIIGKKSELSKKRKIFLLMMQNLNKIDGSDYIQKSKGINDYLNEDADLNEKYKDLINELSDIENSLIKKDKKWFDKDEEDIKIKQIMKLFKLDNYLKNSNVDEFMKFIHRYIFDQVNNYEMDNNLLLEIKKQLLVFKEKECNFLLQLFKDLGDNSELNIELLRKKIKELEIGGIGMYVIENKISYFENEIKLVVYRNNLEQKIGENLESYMNIIRLNISKEKKNELIEKVEYSDKKFFKPYGKELCKKVIVGEDLLDRSPIKWFSKFVKEKPKGFDLELWVALRVIYDDKFGKKIY